MKSRPLRKTIMVSYFGLLTASRNVSVFATVKVVRLYTGWAKKWNNFYWNPFNFILNGCSSRANQIVSFFSAHPVYTVGQAACSRTWFNAGFVKGGSRFSANVNYFTYCSWWVFKWIKKLFKQKRIPKPAWCETFLAVCRKCVQGFDFWCQIHVFCYIQNLNILGLWLCIVLTQPFTFDPVNSIARYTTTW